MTERKANILVVDDEKAMRSLVGRILEREGYIYNTAFDVDDATAKLEGEDFELLISDINMPGKTGIDLLKIAAEKYPDMAVMMVTAIDDRGTAIQALQMGAYGYVVKPFEVNEFVINIANALRRRELELYSRRRNEILEMLVDERTKELQESKEETIQKLARAAEFRDNETAQHTNRMGQYCGLIAQKAGLPEAECEVIRVASVLHDVGKIGIPDKILLKPDKLTFEEFEIIKEHSVIGYRILGDSKSEVLNAGAVIALTHHEKFNGKGYPGGLSGKVIPLSGRIAAICDVFDALTSQRVYKPAMPVEKALTILREESGEHFDPELLKLFLENIGTVLAIREEFADK